MGCEWFSGCCEGEGGIVYSASRCCLRSIVDSRQSTSPRWWGALAWSLAPHRYPWLGNSTLHAGNDLFTGTCHRNDMADWGPLYCQWFRYFQAALSTSTCCSVTLTVSSRRRHVTCENCTTRNSHSVLSAILHSCNRHGLASAARKCQKHSTTVYGDAQHAVPSLLRLLARHVVSPSPFKLLPALVG